MNKRQRKKLAAKAEKKLHVEATWSIEPDWISSKETYMVRFDIRDSNGYWRMNVQEEVDIITTNDQLKNNHDAATKVIEKKYPGCRIFSTTYV